ncbi:MAG: hypothetical protein WAN36_05035, partial [Calditrichia bacterium]
HNPPSNIDTNAVQIIKIDSTKGNGIFQIQVLDNVNITGHDYLVLFHADMSGGVPRNPVFEIIDLTTGDTLLQRSENLIKLDPQAQFKTIPPRVDGLEWTIRSATQIIVDPEENAIHWEGQGDYDITVSMTQKVVSDYRLIFKGEGAENAYHYQDTSQVVMQVPFEAWNLLTRNESGQVVPRKAKIIVNDKGEKGVWDSGDLFFLYENHLVGREPSEMIRTLRFWFDWNENAAPGEPANTKWAVGDTVVIPILVPFHEGDGFIVKTGGIYEVTESGEEELKQIRVVPNPYIVRAGWEVNENSHKLQFINLPSICTIRIFNVAGELVQTLDHDNLYNGTRNWDLRTSNRQEAAPGLYIWVVNTPNGKKEMGKFTIIR